MSQTKKCVVWDLDNTLWNGVCLEGDVSLRGEVKDAILELDRRGILQSIASRGDEETANNTLKGFGLADYFLVPQINWLPKSQSIVRISKDLVLSLDSIAFVDDDLFEREQIAFMLPDVMTIDAREAGGLPDRSEFAPANVTRESRERRRLYQAEFIRKETEQKFSSREDFLRSCEMKMKIRSMIEDDIPRVLELMTRTHQLNTTGRSIEPECLHQILRDPNGAAKVFVAELTDRFGAYGCIGTAMVYCAGSAVRLVYLAISCRVMGRGIERSIVAWIARSGLRWGSTMLEAEFRDTGKNRMMRALYLMMGLRESPGKDDGETSVFVAPCASISDGVAWVEVI